LAEKKHGANKVWQKIRAERVRKYLAYKRYLWLQEVRGKKKKEARWWTVFKDSLKSRTPGKGIYRKMPGNGAVRRKQQSIGGSRSWTLRKKQQSFGDRVAIGTVQDKSETFYRVTRTTSNRVTPTVGSTTTADEGTVQDKSAIINRVTKLSTPSVVSATTSAVVDDSTSAVVVDSTSAVVSITIGGVTDTTPGVTSCDNLTFHSKKTYFNSENFKLCMVVLVLFVILILTWLASITRRKWPPPYFFPQNSYHAIPLNILK
jgi:hypothetical protein